MSMQLSDGVNLRGQLSITIRDALTREVCKTIQINNMIMFLAGDMLVELIAQRSVDGSPAPNDMIYSMRMGSGSTAPSRSDTNLAAPITGAAKSLADVNKVSGARGEIQFTATLEAGDANGFTLSEAGLFTRGSAGSPTPSDAPGTTVGSPRLFARQVHPGVPKTIAVTADYSWRLAFTA